MDDTAELAGGYVATLNMLQIIGKLVILSVFILKENPGALHTLVMMPAAMILFAMMRSRLLTGAVEEAAEKMANMVEIVQEACMKYRLIADYMQRPQMCDLFHEKVEELSEAQIPVEQIKVNNDAFPKWLGALFIGVYIATASESVLNGAASLGTFLATIRIYTELSHQFAEGYKEFIKVLSAVGPLKKLTLYFNRPTDCGLWKNVNRRSRESTHQARENILSSGDAGLTPKPGPTQVQFKSDLIPLKINDMSFCYPNTQPVLHSINLTIAQGKLIMVVGPPGSGKSTFLGLIGRSIFPKEGHLFIPTHLRILHVSQEPCLLNQSVWRNLTFGCQEADPDRARSILGALEMQMTLKLMNQDLVPEKRDSRCGQQDEGTKGDALPQVKDNGGALWQVKLCRSEKAKLHLARALIVNPEVLVLQRPFSHYDEPESQKIMRVIQAHIRNRGLNLLSNNISRRRPRTCFLTPESVQQARNANVIYRVNTKTRTIQQTSFRNLSVGDF